RAAGSHPRLRVRRLRRAAAQHHRCRARPVCGGPEAVSAQAQGTVMQRIQPMDPAGNVELTATYRRITETRGYVSAILKSLSHAPAGLEAFAKYGEYVRYGTELPARVRELSVLAIATGNQYAWSHHHPHALKAGV